MKNREIEVKFLEIDKQKLIEKLLLLGAKDQGDEKITEQIFYDKDRKWIQEHKFVRLRTTSKATFFTYKHTQDKTVSGVLEIEFKITEPEKVKDFLEVMGLMLSRKQEKQRHKFILDDVIVDIDTWPKVPTYVELEGPNEEAIKKAAQTLGFDWNKGVFGTAAEVIEDVYHLPVRSFKYFTFERVE